MLESSFIPRKDGYIYTHFVWHCLYFPNSSTLCYLSCRSSCTLHPFAAFSKLVFSSLLGNLCVAGFESELVSEVSSHDASVFAVGFQRGAISLQTPMFPAQVE